MPSDRELQRQQKAEEKRKRKNKIIWIVIAAVFVLLIIFKIIEVSTSPSDKNGSGSSSKSDSAGFSYTIPNQNLKLTSDGEYVYELDNSSLEKFDKRQKNTLSFNHGMSNPVLKINGNYSLIFDQGGKNYALVNKNSVILQNISENNIICGAVSPHGDIALSTLCDKSKSRIIIFNKKGNREYSFDIADEYAADLAFSDDLKQVAYVTFDSENAEQLSKIYIAGTSDLSGGKSFEFSGSNIYGIKFSGDDLFVIGNDFVSVINNRAEEKYIYKNGAVNIDRFLFLQNGRAVIVTSDYSNNSKHKIINITSKGKKIECTSVNSNIKDISAFNNKIAVLTSDRVTTYNLKSGKTIGTCSVSDSYSKIAALGNSVYALDNSTLKILNEDE